jgi:hypothetical protein
MIIGQIGTEVGAGAIIAGIGTIILPQVFNGVRAILADKAKAKRDEEQTAIFRQMHAEQVSTRISLEKSTATSDARFNAIKDSRDSQHREVMEAIKGSCKYAKP